MVIMNSTQKLQHNEGVAKFRQGITLEPFIHQVAGRATMMCLNETTVCKPLNYREHYFYKSLPPDIQEFAPRYKGVVNVNIEETPDGSVALTAYPFEPDTRLEVNEKSEDDTSLSDSSEEEQDISLRELEADETPKTTNMCKRIKLKRTGSMLVDDVRHSEKTTNQMVNPWIFKVHKEGLKRQLDSKHKVIKQFILLENVTSKFRNPCILDLKMGTRLHGDYDEEEKRIHHERKCATTTTQQLGVRLSGMQVFEAKSGTYFCLDKYYGRKLDKTGLCATLRRFFFDGCRTHYELMYPVLQRLRLIRDRLRRLRTYRFYASSLLIMYDGETDLLSKNSAPTGHAGKCNATTSSESDIVGSSPSLSPQANGDSVRVDIRMIDFAKSTNEDMDSSFVHDGPDHGYIFGLTNLIELLKDIVSSPECDEVK